MNKCKYCGKVYFYDRSKGHRKDICKSCRTRLYRYDLKKKLVDIAGGKCIVCGYNKCIRALDFHHRNPSEKKFSLSTPDSHKINDLIIEINKCDLLCANCHREIHEIKVPIRNTRQDSINFTIKINKIISCELINGLNGCQISKKHSLNKKTVYNYINKKKNN
jgi:hypothetical protein